MGCLQCICCCIISIGLSVFVTCLLLSLVVLRPAAPIVDLHSLNVSGLSTSGSSVSATFDVSYNIYVHKWHCYYENWEVRVLYKDTVLGTGVVGKFDVGSWKSPSRVTKIAAASAPLDSSNVNDLNSDKSKGKLKFDVEMKAEQTQQFNRFLKTPNYVIKEKCKDVEVNFKNSSGNSYFEHRDCKPEIKRHGFWIRPGRVEK